MPINNLISINIPAGSKNIFINNVGCLRYTRMLGETFSHSSCVEPSESGVYLEVDKHEIVGCIQTEINKEEMIVVIREK